MGALPNPFSFFFFLLLLFFSMAAADQAPDLRFPRPFLYRFQALEGAVLVAPPPPFASAPPPEEKPVYAPFRPSMAVVVGVLTTTFSITFLLLLYAKHCKRGNVVVVGYSRRPNSMGSGPNPSFSARKNSGIDQAVIESLPIFRFGSLSGQKEGLECAVCLNRFEPTEVLRLLPKCKHAFHVECVDTWLDAHSTCPLCRYRVDPEDVLLVEDVNILVHNQAAASAGANQISPPPPPLPPPPPPRDSKSKDVVLNLEPGRRSGGKAESGRVSGRHSSVGEKRTGGFWQNLMERTGESSSRDPALFRRSLDSSSAAPRKRTETVAVGCFDRPRKDGLLLPDEKPNLQNQNQNQNQNRFEHRIIVSPRGRAGEAQRQRWSDVQASDLLYLRSEMIISESRRYSAASLPPELKRQRRMGMTRMTMAEGEAQ